MYLSPILLNQATKKINRYKTCRRMTVYLILPIVVISWMIGAHIGEVLHNEMMDSNVAMVAIFVLAFSYHRLDINITHSTANLKRLEDAPESLRSDPINGVVSLERQVNRSFWNVLKKGF